jgi:hypothetical protein
MNVPVQREQQHGRFYRLDPLLGLDSPFSPVYAGLAGETAPRCPSPAPNFADVVPERRPRPVREDDDTVAPGNRTLDAVVVQMSALDLAHVPLRCEPWWVVASPRHSVRYGGPPKTARSEQVHALSHSGRSSSLNRRGPGSGEVGDDVLTKRLMGSFPVHLDIWSDLNS